MNNMSNEVIFIFEESTCNRDLQINNCLWRQAPMITLDKRVSRAEEVVCACVREWVGDRVVSSQESGDIGDTSSSDTSDTLTPTISASVMIMIPWRWYLRMISRTVIFINLLSTFADSSFIDKWFRNSAFQSEFWMFYLIFLHLSCLWLKSVSVWR